MRFTLKAWIKFWKSEFSRAHVHAHWEWQRNGFHHRLRDERERQEKWIYMRENPIRQGLVKQSDDWPFQGMIHELR